MRLPFLSLVSFFLAGCSSHYEKAQLVGKYVLNVGHGDDLLELKSDGTYTHSFQAQQNTTATGSGKWELESYDAGPTVTLDDFQRLPGEPSGGSGYYLLTIKSFFGKICLMTNEDTNECYEKQP
jgi:hypothetical protein